MKKLLLLLTLIVSMMAWGQVRIEKSATQLQNEKMSLLSDSIKRQKIAEYDSLSNRVPSDSLFLLVGQRIILKPYNREKTPYDGFYKKDGQKYAKVDVHYGKTGCAYDSLVGRTFSVIDYDKNFPPKLYIADEKDTLYIGSSAERYYYIEGYLTKLSEKFVGQKFARVVSSYDNDPKDFKTGKPIKLKVGDTWTINRLILNPENGNIDAILTNSVGNELAEQIVGFSSFFDIYYKPKSESDKWRKKYGEYCWKKILQNEIYVGMPSSAVKLAWGEPKYINDASYGDQWVYNNGYVYIKNGKVTSWN